MRKGGEKIYPEKFKRSLESAFDYSRSDDYQSVIRVCSSLLEDDPVCKPVLILMAEALRKTGNTREALEHTKKSVGFHPQSELLSLLHFHALLDSQLKEQAIEEVRRFLHVKESPEYRTIIKENGWEHYFECGNGDS